MTDEQVAIIDAISKEWANRVAGYQEATSGRPARYFLRWKPAKGEPDVAVFAAEEPRQDEPLEETIGRIISALHTNQRLYGVQPFK